MMEVLLCACSIEYKFYWSEKLSLFVQCYKQIQLGNEHKHPIVDTLRKDE